MNTSTIQPSTTLDQACNRFLIDLESWIYTCIERYADQPATDVHDQGTFTTGWLPYIQATEDQTVLRFMQTLRDKIEAHFVSEGAWKHGYWTMQEAHHGTEHFELFLGTLLRLAPNDEITQHQLVDVAEHMGNWVEEIPPWFDWESGLFYSLFFGSDGVQNEPGMALNMPDHIRCVNICLLAYEASQDGRFLDLSTLYAGQWADAIIDKPELPIALTKDGPVYRFGGKSQEIYRAFAGEAPDLDTTIDRAENLMTSDAIHTFLQLWQLTNRNTFLQAVEKLLDILITQLHDPDAGPVSHAVRQYRTMTESERYDQAILTAVEQLHPKAIQTLSIKLPPPQRGRTSGIGKRGDMPIWLENGQPRRHNPILLALAAEIQQDEELAIYAIDLARTYFALARDVLPDGRDHGCSARSVSAVARGHGRNNHAGMTTAVLQPILKANQIGYNR